ncbi:MAG: shikimate kinase [Clostridia bacterium]|nr:shikimate kinase [Clostridia bacterium]
MKRESVTLIGMPASGKSTVGVILAKVLGYHFVDTDLVLQTIAGKRLSGIIAQYGLEGFKQIESESICSLKLPEGAPSVIATGGSVVYSDKAMQYLRRFGPVIYLQVDYDTIESRLEDIRQRGVVLKAGQSLRSLYEERIPLYERYADFVICEGSNGIESVAHEASVYMESRMEP